MKVIKKDLLTVEEGIICHQVNTLGIMGAGVAKQVKAKFPKVFKIYKDSCDMALDQNEFLGEMLLVDVSDKLYVANLFGQNSIGRQGVHTRYESLEKALDTAFYMAKRMDLPIYAPYLMGCSLGGGLWPIVKKIIEECEYKYQIELTACRLSGF